MIILVIKLIAYYLKRFSNSLSKKKVSNKQKYKERRKNGYTHKTKFKLEKKIYSFFNTHYIPVLPFLFKFENKIISTHKSYIYI